MTTTALSDSYKTSSNKELDPIDLSYFAVAKRIYTLAHEAIEPEVKNLLERGSSEVEKLCDQVASHTVDVLDIMNLVKFAGLMNDYVKTGQRTFFDSALDFFNSTFSKH